MSHRRTTIPYGRTCECGLVGAEDECQVPCGLHMQPSALARALGDRVSAVRLMLLAERPPKLDTLVVSESRYRRTEQVSPNHRRTTIPRR